MRAKVGAGRLSSVLPHPAAPSSISSPRKEFTNKTAAQLLAVFDGGIDVGASLRKDGRPISCRFSKDWDIELRRYDAGSVMKVIGKILPRQNGQQLYLGKCELDDSLSQ